MALVLAPSLVMGIASFSTGILTIASALQNGRNIVSVIPNFIMSLSMLAGMVLFPFIFEKRDREKRKKELERRKNI